jgi:hypothetical protein
MPMIHGITYDELGRLGVDDDNRLYWDEKPVVLESRLALAWWVNIAVVVGALATAVLASIEVLKFCGFGPAGP